MEKKRIIRNIIIKIVLFIIGSLWEFFYLELFFKKTVPEFPLDIIIRNVVLIMLVNLILLCILHSMKTAFLISCIFVLIIGIANYFVISFRGYGIVFMDFYAVKTAANVAGGYSYNVDSYFITGCVAAVVQAGLLVLLLRHKRKKRILEGSPIKLKSYFNKNFMAASFAGLVVSVLFIVWINFDAFFFKGISSITWDHNIGINDYGYLLYFLSNAEKTDIDEPAGYSVQKVDKILSAYEEPEEGSTQKQSPNIIMIMNESFSDLRVLGELDTDEDVLSFYDSLHENTIKGYVQSSVYGGYTANSEFEFLTGCSKAFLPGNPYLQYMDDYLPSIISNIKSQEGYSEAIAVHPYNPSGYNRNRIYPLLYFDKFLAVDDFENPLFVRSYISDLSDYKKIEELYEQKEEGTSLCVFNVTMQNHNPYNSTGYKFEEDVKVTSFNSDMQTEQYLSLIKMSDDALKQLVTYFKNVDEPVAILLFGDHQPHLPDSFYKHIMGKEPLQFTQEDTMKKYEVPFLIWANYDIPEMEIERASINYLSSIFLSATGLKMSNFNRYLLDLYKKLPAISAVGSYDSSGKLHEDKEKNTEYAELMKEYEMIQYNYLFDEEHRLDRHYKVNAPST